LLIVVVSDEPDVSRRLEGALQQLSGRHDLMWAMVSDMPAVAVDGPEGYDVGTGAFVLGGADAGERVVAAYRRAEAERAARLDAFLTSYGVAYTKIAGSSEIRPKIVEMTEVFNRAG
jgi:hypothetical protein